MQSCLTFWILVVCVLDLSHSHRDRKQKCECVISDALACNLPKVNVMSMLNFMILDHCTCGNEILHTCVSDMVTFRDLAACSFVPGLLHVDMSCMCIRHADMFSSLQWLLSLKGEEMLWVIPPSTHPHSTIMYALLIQPRSTTSDPRSRIP